MSSDVQKSAFYSTGFNKLMKIIKPLIFILIVILLSATALATDTDDILTEQREALFSESELTDALPPDIAKALEDNGISPDEDIKNLDIFGIIGSLLGNTLKNLKIPITIFGISIGVCLICKFVLTLNPSEDIKKTINVVSTLSIAASAILPAVDCIKYAGTVIKDCADFLLTFIPIFGSVLTVSGRPASAAMYSGTMVTVAEGSAQIGSNILLPLCGIFLAISICGAVNSEINISSLTANIKSFVTWGLGILLTIFVGLLGAGTLVTASSDTVAVKGIKFMTGSFIPVVGGAVSDAMGSVNACMGLIKSSLGAYGIISLIMLFVPPLLSCIAVKASLSLSASMAEILDVSGGKRLLSAASDAMALVIAILAALALLTIISGGIITSMGTGG